MGEIENRFIEAFELLESKNLISTRGSAANILGYKQQNLTEILKGRSKTNPYLIQKFCKEYNVNIDYIIFGETPIIRDGKSIVSINPSYSISTTKEKKDSQLGGFKESIEAKDMKIEFLEKENSMLRKHLEQANDTIKSLNNLLQNK